MKRFRVSTLLLLIVIAALGLTVTIQHRKIARLESDKESLDDLVKVLESDKSQGWLVREGQGKTPRSRRSTVPITSGPNLAK